MPELPIPIDDVHGALRARNTARRSYVKSKHDAALAILEDYQGKISVTTLHALIKAATLAQRRKLDEATEQWVMVYYQVNGQLPPDVETTGG